MLHKSSAAFNDAHILHKIIQLNIHIGYIVTL